MSQQEDDAKMVEEMERLEREASGGPWKDEGSIVQDVSPWNEVIGLEEFGGPWHYDHSLSIKECDRALITFSRNNLPRLLALAKIGVLAVAYRKIDAAFFDERVRDPRADLYLLFSDMSIARAAIFSAIDAYKEQPK